MPYIRTMPDGSKKTYHTMDEMSVMLDKSIEKNARILLQELKEIKMQKKQGIHTDIQSNKIVHV